MASTARVSPAPQGAVPQAPSPGAWREDQGHFSLEYSRPVLEEIRAAVARAAFGIGRGGVEVGGLLFGTRLGSFVRIQAWMEIPCRHALGPVFRLDGSEMEVLGLLCEERGGREDLKDLQLLGWFVAHSRGELALSPDDVRLADRHFADPDQFAIVFKPGRFGELEGVIFRRGSDGGLQPATPSLFIEPRPALLALAAAPRRAMERKPVSAAAPQPAAPATRAGRAGWTAVALAILLTAGVAGSGWLAWNSWRGLAAAAQPVLLLSFDAQAQGEDLRLSWNPRSERAAAGARAFLTVHGEDFSYAVPLTHAELLAGSYTLAGAAAGREASLSLIKNGQVVYTEYARRSATSPARSSRP